LICRKADESERVPYAEVDVDLIAESREARPYLELRRPEFCTLSLTDMGA
jgi:hypothetical protein